MIGEGNTMEKIYISSSIINEFIFPEFQMSEMQNLWKSCFNGMLWEAIMTDYTKMTRKDILNFLRHEESVILFSEPLPSFYLGLQQEACLVSADTLLSNAQAWLENKYASRGNNFLEIEPLYMLDEKRQWMLVLTIGHRATGEELQALLKRRVDC